MTHLEEIKDYVETHMNDGDKVQIALGIHIKKHDDTLISIDSGIVEISYIVFNEDTVGITDNITYFNKRLDVYYGPYDVDLNFPADEHSPIFNAAIDALKKYEPYGKINSSLLGLLDGDMMDKLTDLYDNGAIKKIPIGTKIYAARESGPYIFYLDESQQKEVSTLIGLRYFLNKDDVVTMIDGINDKTITPQDVINMANKYNNPLWMLA